MFLQTVIRTQSATAPSVIPLLMNIIALMGLLVLIIIAVLWFIIRKSRKEVRYRILLLTVPKYSQDPDGEHKQTVEEQLGQVENLFSSLGSLKADRSIGSWFGNRQDHLSLEIVARHGEISFYAAIPESMYDFFVYQINSVHHTVHIQEVEDYNIFYPQSSITGGYIKTKRSYVFPLKTYTDFEFDPLETLINALSKLDEGDSIAIQYVIRSAKGVWHQSSARIARALREGKTLKEAIATVQKSSGISSSISGSLFSTLSAQPKKATDEPRRLEPSQANIKMAEGIEQKNSKAGFDVNIRVVSSSLNKLRAESHLRDVVNSFGQYNLYEIGNSLTTRQVHSRDRLVRDFIYRRFNQKASQLLNSEELTGMWHLPGPTIDAPYIRWLEARKASPPSNLPVRGICVGQSDYRGHIAEIRIKPEDRRRHIYTIGQTGTGKSALMQNMIVQDIQAGEGCCVIDPHGDLVEAVLTMVPEERMKDVILFDPSDVERPLGLNMLEYASDDQKTFVVNEIIKIFDKLYDLEKTGGPMFEQYMRNTVLLMMEDVASGSTLMEVSKVLADEEFRRYKLSKTKNPVVRDFWLKEAHKAGGEAALQNMVPYITSKLTQFIANDIMRPIIGQQHSSFNFRQVMDEQKILLVNLSKGKIGELNSSLLGMVVVGKILLAALSRVDTPESERKDFYLYIDEFQNFVTDSIAVILSEARKYKLNLTIAHQYVSQLVKSGDTQVRDAVFGNVGTKIAFRIGSEDAELLAKEFAPVFNEYDLLNIPKFNAYIKLLIDNQNPPAFNMVTKRPEVGDAQRAIKIKELSRKTYGRPRAEIEKEILERSHLRDGGLAI